MAATIEKVPVSDLLADPGNLRVHDSRNVQTIAASLTKFGQQKPIVIDKDGVVIAGNGTLEAAASLGWESIDCVRSELEGSDRTAYAIADNRTAELAEWDYEPLTKMLGALDSEGFDLGSLGWTDEEVEDLAESIPEEEVEADEVATPAFPETAETKRGDLYILGRHRLLCGDSGSVGDVDRLLAGARIQLCNTDPPWNVKVEPRSNTAIAAGLSSFPGSGGEADSVVGANDRPLANDCVTDEEFALLLRSWFGNIARVLEPGRGFYIWGGYSNIANYPSALEDCELYFSQAVIWVKGHPVLTRKDFMGNHDWGFYGWRKGAGHKWYGPNNAVDVWEIKKINPHNMIHLTEKPVGLAGKALAYSSRKDENVLDLFGGSGSTMMACEQMERTCFTMEMDELYCDVIVKRWEEHTGRKAERES